MAWAEKWRVRRANPQTTNVWRAYIEEDGATFDSELDPGPIPFDIDYKCNNSKPDWCFAPSTCSVAFIDDITGKLSAIFTGGTDTRYRIRLTEEVGATEFDRWLGFLQVDSYQYNHLAPGPALITATDRLNILKEVAYESAPGVPYTGQEKVSTMIARCLAAAGLGIGIATHSTRYSWLDSNALDDTPGSSDDPLAHHTWDQSVYVNDNGDPWSCWDVLEDICIGWGLQIFQDSIGGNIRWCAFERKRNAQVVSPFFFDAHLYTEAGVSEGTSSADTRMQVSITENSDLKFVQNQATIKAAPPIGTASYIFNHGDLGDLWENLGFEEALSNGWTAGVGMTRSENAFAGSKALDVDIDFDLDEDWINSVDVEQTAKHSVESATGYKWRISFYVNAPDINDLPTSEGYLKLYWSFEHGTDYYRFSDSTWQTIGASTEKDIANEIPLHLWATGPGYNQFINIVTPAITGLSGAPVFKIRGATEHDNGTDSQTQNTVLVDAVDITLLDNNGLEIFTSRQTTSAVENTANPAAETVQLMFGEGPLTAFPGAIRALNSLGTDVGLAENFSRGVPGSEPSPAVTFDQHHNVERLEQFYHPPRVVDGPIIFYGNVSASELRPSNQILIENPEDSTQQEYSWYKGYNWKPANPEQHVRTTWCAIQTVTLPTTNHAITSIEDPTTVGGARNNTTVITLAGTSSLETVPDHSNLEALAVGENSSAVVMESYTSGKTLGEGVFVMDSEDSSTPANDITVFDATDGKKIKRVEAGRPWLPSFAGALGDGTTADDGFIQDLIDEAGKTGKELSVPPGRYVIDNSLIIDGIAITIDGQNHSMWLDDGRTGYPTTAQGAVFMSGPNLTGPMFIIRDTVNSSEDFAPATIKNLRMIGNRQGAGTDTHGIQVIGVSGVRLVHNNISQFSGRGISVEQSAVGNLLAPTAIRIRDNFITFNDGIGLWCKMSSGFVTENLIHANELGGMVEDAGSFANVIRGNQILSNEFGGLECFGLGFNQIEYNHVSSNTGRGILVTAPTGNVDSTTIVGNTCLWNGSDSGLGNDERSGIVVSNLINGTITGNTLSYNEAYGLFLGGSWECSISGNSGGGNTLGFSNTRLQSLTPLGGYNVIEFGALQFNNDASLVIQAVIDNAPTGSTVVVPAGDFLIGTTININKALRILATNTPDEAANQGSYFKGADTLDGPLINVNAAGVIIEGLSFLGNALAPTTAASGILYGPSASDCKLSECVLTGFKGHGVDTDAASSDILLHRITAKDNGLSGVRAQGTDITVTLSKIDGNGNAGVYGLGSIRLQVLNNPKITGSGWSGVLLSGGTDGLVQSNHIFANSVAGVAFTGASERHTAALNKIDGNGTDTGRPNVERAGIYIKEGANHSVYANDSGDKGGSPTQLFGISTDSLLTSASILNNTGIGNATDYYSLDSTTAGDLDIDLEHVENIDLPNLTAGSSHTETITITGARAGDRVTIGAPAGIDLDLDWKGVVTADDEFKLRVINNGGSAINEAAADWKITLRRRAGVTASVPTPSSLEWVIDVAFDNPNLLLDA